MSLLMLKRFEDKCLLTICAPECPVVLSLLDVFIQILLMSIFCWTFLTFEVLLLTMNQLFVSHHVAFPKKWFFADITIIGRWCIPMFSIQMSGQMAGSRKGLAAFWTLLLRFYLVDFSHVTVSCLSVKEYLFTDAALRIPPCWCQGFLVYPWSLFLWKPMEVSRWCWDMLIAARPYRPSFIFISSQKF